MSLTHGHYYAASKIREKLAGFVKEVTDAYPDAYFMGSAGHDIIYWAGTYNAENKIKAPPLPSLILPSDPHQKNSGQMIQNLVDHYIAKSHEENQSFSAIEKRLLQREAEINKRLPELLEQRDKLKDDEKLDAESEIEELKKENQVIEKEKQALGKSGAALKELQEILEKEKNASPEEKIKISPIKASLEDKFKALEKERKKPLEEYLAFVLGWITHWTTDLYIHSLIDVYGGRYDSEAEKNPQVSRHIQLELVETKYLCANNNNLASITLNNREDVWRYAALPVSQTYDEARVYVGPKKYYSPDKRPYIFSTAAFTGLCVVQQGLGIANECCKKKGDEPTSIFNSVAENQWAAKGAHIPSTNLYEAIRKPMKIDSVKAEAAKIEFAISIGDTGLYGKFLNEYDSFMNASIDRAVAVINEVESIISSSSPLEIKSVGDADILLPEAMLEALEPSLMNGVNDYTIRDTVHRNSFEKHKLCYNFGYKVIYERKNYEDHTSYSSRNEGSSPWNYSEEIAAKNANKLYDSRAGNIVLPIQINNPLSNNYEVVLRVSLTDNNAFAKKKHPDVEIATYEGKYQEGLIRCINYDRNRRKIEEGDELNYAKTGRWVRYYPGSKKKREEGDYLNDKETGLWTYYDSKGRITKKGEYLEGKLSGHWVFYNENGTVKEEGDYREDKKEGCWTRYFDDGQKSAEEEYKNDLRDGHWIYYRQNGKKSQEGNCREGSDVGHWINYFENGAISQEGDANGGFINYHENGNKSGEMSASGQWTGWSPEGIKIVEGSYAQGAMGRERSGQWTNYYDTGAKASEGDYTNDNPSGHWTYWYPNGNKKTEGNWGDGSDWTYWDENGKQVTKEEFRG
jgi:antitoxin component YwqK of YwqJK toxin-antitoxin module